MHQLCECMQSVAQENGCTRPRYVHLDAHRVRTSATSALQNPATVCACAITSTHMGNKFYKCDLSSERVGNCETTREHMRVRGHTKFSHRTTLLCHERKHTGEKPCKCDLCIAEFSSGAGLLYHKRKHRGEKPYKCDLSTAEFIQSFSLSRHK
ncbi:zinc finger protein 600-like [Ornithodoros turicata]|uniref:zinc finger protein 600-like n=1 Tax=Ornithodoros turicata TaxID=34597 RepID=UPI003139DEC4